MCGRRVTRTAVVMATAEQTVAEPRSQALKLGSSMLKALQIAVETTKARSSAHKVAKLYPSSRASGDWASDLNIAFDV